MKKLLILLPALLAIACQQRDNQPAGTGRQQPAASMDAALQGLFEPQIVVKMHFFSSRDTGAVAVDYPYAGKKIGGQHAPRLAGSLTGRSGGDLHACYFIENAGAYILRRGRELLLARWNESSGQLEERLVLASHGCQAGNCRQQDAWLIDLDDDRSLEVVVRRQETDAGGKVLADDFKVLSQKEGGYSDGPPQLLALAVKDRYLLH